MFSMGAFRGFLVSASSCGSRASKASSVPHGSRGKNGGQCSSHHVRSNWTFAFLAICLCLAAEAAGISGEARLRKAGMIPSLPKGEMHGRGGAAVHKSSAIRTTTEIDASLPDLADLFALARSDETPSSTDAKNHEASQDATDAHAKDFFSQFTDKTMPSNGEKKYGPPGKRLLRRGRLSREQSLDKDKDNTSFLDDTTFNEQQMQNRKSSKSDGMGVEALLPFVDAKPWRALSTASNWTQLGADIDGEAAGDYFGNSVAMSADGRTVAVGAQWNDGNGDKSGHVRIFSYNETSSSFEQLGSDIDGEAAGDHSGRSVAISADGRIVAVGAIYNKDNGIQSGHVRVYAYNETSSTFEQLGSDIDGEDAYSWSGESVALSADGSIVAIGAIYPGTGHVRIYAYNEMLSTFEKLGTDISGEAHDDNFGTSIALSDDGHTLAVGAPNNDDNGSNSGHVRVYAYNDTSSNFEQVGSDIDGKAANDKAGRRVALSADGRTVAVGAPYYDGNSTDPNDNRGHVRIFAYDNSTSDFEQLGSDIVGESGVALSANGRTVAVYGNWDDENGIDSGHVRVFDYDDSTSNFKQVGSDIDGKAAGEGYGLSVALSADGRTVAGGSSSVANFVRIYVSSLPPIDTDTDVDGLSDGDEANLGTDPNNPDTDGDGLPDGTDPDPLIPETDIDGPVISSELSDGRDSSEIELNFTIGSYYNVSKNSVSILETGCNVSNAIDPLYIEENREVLEGNIISVKLDLVQANIASGTAPASLFDDTNPKSAVVKFCIRLDMNQQVDPNNSADVQSIAYKTTEVELTIDMTSNFTVESISLANSVTETVTDSASVQYTLNAYQCDNTGIENTGTNVPQNERFNICVELDDSTNANVGIFDIDSLEFSQLEGNGLTLPAITNGAPNTLTSKGPLVENKRKWIIESMLLSSFFDPESISDVKAEGTAILQFQGDARRLAEISIRSLQGQVPALAGAGDYEVELNLVGAEENEPKTNLNPDASAGHILFFLPWLGAVQGIFVAALAGMVFY